MIVSFGTIVVTDCRRLLIQAVSSPDSACIELAAMYKVSISTNNMIGKQFSVRV